MFNWRELPFVRLFLPFAVGIGLSYFTSFNHPFLLFGLSFFFLILAFVSSKIRGLYRHRWVFGTLVGLFLFLLGYQIGHYYDVRNSHSYFGKSIGEKEAYLLVEVDDAPVRKGDWVRLKSQLKGHGGSADSIEKSTGRILLYVSREVESEAIKYGDRLLVSAAVAEVEPPSNPHAFDYRNYLRFKNIHHQAFVREGDWQLVGSGFGNPFFGKAIDLQKYFLATLRKHLPTENEFSVGSALILGYRDEIPDEVKTAYSNTGAMHVLAVSGLHVGIIFLLLNFFLKKIKLQAPWWRYTKAALVLLGIWSFALVTGLSPSVTRAAVMFTCMQFGLAFQRDPNIYNTLLASAFIMLLFNPFALASVSFQLSYLAVFGIVFFQERLAKMIYVRNRFLDKMWQLFCVSVAAQFMLVPLTLYYFHQFPTYFWLSSLLLVPLAGFELTAGIFLLFFEVVWPALATVFGKALWLMLWVGNEFVLFVQNLPGALVDGIWMSGIIVPVLYLIISFIMATWASRKMRWAVSALALFTVVSIHFAFVSWEKTEARELVVYDVYKHTAIDIFEGKKVVTILSANVDEKSLLYATEGHRFAMGMDEIHSISLASNEPHEVGSVFFKNKFLQFDELRMFIITGPIHFDLEEKMKLDYVLVSSSPKIFIEEIQAAFEFEKIIFDSSNKKWKVAEWKEKCEALNIEYYDVAEEGAFVFDLKK